MRGSISSPTKPNDPTVLRTITNIGRFNPKVFVPKPRVKTANVQNENQITFNAEGMRALQQKLAKVSKRVASIENEVNMLQSSIDRHQAYLSQMIDEHDQQVQIIQQQITNRKAQIAKVDNAQEPPTTNQIFALVRQIQVEGMAAKRRAENCFRDQDINLVLSGDRLRKFHDFLAPRVTDQLLQENPKLRKAYDRMEAGVYKTAEIQTQLRGLKVYSSNLEKKLIELHSRQESLQFDKADIQMGIVDKKEELRAELTKRSEEIGKLKWKIAYLRALKSEMDTPHFDVRVPK